MITLQVPWEEIDLFLMDLLQSLRGSIKKGSADKKRLTLVITGSLDDEHLEIELSTSNEEIKDQLVINLIRPQHLLVKLRQHVDELISLFSARKEMNVHFQVATYGWRVLPRSPLRINNFILSMEIPTVLTNLSGHVNNPFDKQNISIYSSMRSHENGLFVEFQRQASDFAAWLSLMLRWYVSEPTSLSYPFDPPSLAQTKSLSEPYKVEVAYGIMSNLKRMDPREVRELTHAWYDWEAAPYFEPFEFARDTEELYLKYEKMDRTLKREYTKSCYAYQEAHLLRYLGEYFASYVSMVSAVESLANHIYSKDRIMKEVTCPQCRHSFKIPANGISERFTRFVQKYTPNLKTDRKRIKSLYDLRSKRVHAMTPTKRDKPQIGGLFSDLKFIQFIQNWRTMEELTSESLTNFLRET